MKKKLFFILCIVIITQSCSGDYDGFESREAEITNFPSQSEILGKAVAEELRETIKNLNEMGVDYSNANNSTGFKDRFYEDFYKASPSIKKTKASTTQLQMASDNFIEKYNNLTEIQINFVSRIIKECGDSRSYEDFSRRLININEDIYKQVPKIQQERLFNVTAVLYYGMTEIHNLEKQGQMILTPYNRIHTKRLKSGGEPDPGSGWGASCRKFLAAGWVIALGEPTPAGEIVMSVATVIIGGILLYEVITCSKNTIDCSSKYAECVDSGRLPSWKCYDCFRYCQGQNVWDCPRPY